MIETIFKLVVDKTVDHWEGLLTIVLIVLYGRNDYRVSKLENQPQCRSVDECRAIIANCSSHHDRRFGEGRREFDDIKVLIKSVADKQDILARELSTKQDNLVKELSAQQSHMIELIVDVVRDNKRES